VIATEGGRCQVERARQRDTERCVDARRTVDDGQGDRQTALVPLASRGERGVLETRHQLHRSLRTSGTPQLDAYLWCSCSADRLGRQGQGFFARSFNTQFGKRPWFRHIERQGVHSSGSHLDASARKQRDGALTGA